MTFRISKWIGLIALAFIAFPAPTEAVDEAELLPVDRAFVLSANPKSRTEVEFRFDIAPGYYLYKHRIQISPVDASFKINPLQLPAGKKKTDEFFGEVETYRNLLLANITGAAASNAEEISFTVKYQGCADVGVCYPPQRKTIALALPIAVTPATQIVAAAQKPNSNALPIEIDPVYSASPESAKSGGDSLILFGNNAAANNAMDPLPADLTQSNSDPLAILKSGNQNQNLLLNEAALPPEQAFVFEAIATSGDEILARFSMPKNYYLYRDKTVFRILDQAGSPIQSITMAAPKWPEGVAHKDEHFGDVTVYFDQVEVPIVLGMGRSTPNQINLEASFQGCQNEGICYPPMKRLVSLVLPAITEGANNSSANTATPAMQATPEAAQSEQDQFTASLKSGSKLKALAIFFLVGIGLAFTPCVFPMVPILSGIIAGHGEHVTTKRAFVLSLVYVIANAMVFAVIGVIAGLAGQNLAAILQKPAILIGFAGLFVLLALSMFGFYELQVPTALQNRINRFSNNQKSGSLIGVVVMGILSALLVGPCVAPPLAGAVLYISQERDAVLGGIALFIMAMGMGVPLIAFGMGAGHIMPRAGAWMEIIKAVFGFVFLWLALWMLERVLDPFWIMFIAGVLLISQGIHMRALDRLPEPASGWQKTGKALGVVFLILGAIELIGAASGGRDFTNPLAHLQNKRELVSGVAAEEQVQFKKIRTSEELDLAVAAANARGVPVLFDFYADWCVACKEMEKYTFTDVTVIKNMQAFELLKVDVTDQNSGDIELQQRFQIVGPPATLFFDLQGQENKTLRLVGYEKANLFVTRLQSAKTSIQ